MADLVVLLSKRSYTIGFSSGRLDAATRSFIRPMSIGTAPPECGRMNLISGFLSKVP